MRTEKTTSGRSVNKLLSNSSLSPKLRLGVDFVFPLSQHISLATYDTNPQQPMAQIPGNLRHKSPATYRTKIWMKEVWNLAWYNMPDTMFCMMKYYSWYNIMQYYVWCNIMHDAILCSKLFILLQIPSFSIFFSTLANNSYWNCEFWQAQPQPHLKPNWGLIVISINWSRPPTYPPRIVVTVVIKAPFVMFLDSLKSLSQQACLLAHLLTWLIA